jgi:hypothetical protein
MSDQPPQGAKRVFLQPAFVVVAAILLVAAAGLNAATSYLQLYFRKLPAPLSRPLAEVPQNLGPWVQVTIDEPLDAENQEALATDKYIFRDYVDTRQLKPDELSAFQDRTGAERKKLAARLQYYKPTAVMNLALTYYTGLADTVAHIPDRCYIADGYVPTKYDIAEWDVLKGRPGDQKARFIVFEDLSAASSMSVKRNVGYFFQCNGEYCSDPMTVRKNMADLRMKYGYYMKVELQMLNVPAEQCSRTMNEFLGYVLPEAEKCLPDWKTLSTKK